MSDEKLIHVKFAYSEAIETKRNFLAAEIELLKLIKSIKRYRVLRAEELKIKLKLHRKLKELNTKIRKMTTVLPKLQLPKILKDQEEEEKQKLAGEDSKEKEQEKTESPQVKEVKKTAYDKDLESQLKDIQKQLMELG